MKRYLVMGALVCAIPGAAFAQGRAYTDYGASEGDREFTIAGTGSSEKDFDNSSVGISADLGWYLSDQMAAGIRQSLSFADIEGQDVSDDYWNGATRGYLDYHFGDAALRPFIGASLGYAYGDGVNDSFFAGPELGLKYYVLPDTFITGRAEYQFFFEEASGADEAFEDGAWAYTIGVGFNF